MNEAVRQQVHDPAFEEVYKRLRHVARRERRRVGAGDTINTTALVHEVYLDICKCEAQRAVPAARRTAVRENPR